MGLHYFFVIFLTSTAKHLEDDPLFPTEPLLISVYLTFTSFRLFLQSLLVGLLCQSPWMEGAREPDFIPLLEWNETFKSNWAIVFHIIMNFILPLAEFHVEEMYWPAMTHSEVWSLGGFDSLEVECKINHSETADKVSFSIIGIPLTLVLLIAYVIILCVTGSRVPEFDEPSPPTFRSWIRVNRLLMAAKAQIEYLLLFSSQVMEVCYDN